MLPQYPRSIHNLYIQADKTLRNSVNATQTPLQVNPIQINLTPSLISHSPKSPLVV
jgi:hypothetical protein